MSNETVLLAKHNIFTLALMVSIFTHAQILLFLTTLLWINIRKELYCWKDSRKDFWRVKEIEEQGHEAEEYHCGCFH